MGKVLYQGKSEDGVYPIYPHRASQLHLSSKVCNHVSKVCNNVSRSINFNKTLWHMRLGHPHDQVLKYVFPNDRSVMNKCTNLVQSCTHCLYGKMHNLPFPKSQFVASSPFEFVHSDVWGPAPSHLSLVFVIMFSLLIILQGSLGYIFLSPNLKCFPSFFCLRPWLKHSSLPK